MPLPSTPSRSAFEQDFDRIIFSHPFRKLQDKTQVHPLPEHDFVHTRLTHSLEVSSVARSLGKRVGEVVIQRHQELAGPLTLFDFGAITAAAALTHDVGNPPFGHAGEDALSDYFQFNPEGQGYRQQVTPKEWNDLIQFEGNAQGFRILNQNRYGLKLTYATLGAFTKYPRESVAPTPEKKHTKFGFFQSEVEVFQKIASSTGLQGIGENCWCRHPLAFLVEAADDICYSLIDLEDACILGLVSFEEARDFFNSLITSSRGKLGKFGALHGVHERLGYLRALAIGDLIEQCADVFLDYEQDILAGKFTGGLVDSSPSSGELKKIIALSRERIYRARHVVEIEASGHEVLPGLLSAFCEAAQQLHAGKPQRKFENLLRLLPDEILFDLNSSGDSTYRTLRIVIDFVSGLTDRHALSLFKKIKGIYY